MSTWTIKQRIVFGFSVILLLFAVVAVTSALLLRTVAVHQTSLTQDALPGLESSQVILATASEIQLGTLRHILTTNADDKSQFDEEIKTLIAKQGNELTNYETTIFRQNDREQFERVKGVRDSYLQKLESLLDLSRAGKEAEAAALNKESLRPAYVAFQKECQALFDENKACGDDAATASGKALSLTNWLITTLSVGAIVLGIVFATLLVIGLSRILNRLARNLNENSCQIATAAGQVSSASQTLAEGASEQAASIEETSSSLEEMAAMTKRNAENAQRANDLAKEARAAADKGATDMQAMAAAMDALKASSDDIAKIIKTIDEIAFQTNILALNAAVEAARAGEAGMGFAVVADEVRNLAQRSAQAAKETAVKIEGAIGKSAQGVGISNQVTRTLNEILTKVRQVDELATEVAGASREQTQGISQINQAVGQMDKVTQNNASSAEESAAAAEELNAQAETMKQSIGELVRLIGNSRHGHGKESSAAMPEGTLARTRSTPPASSQKISRPTVNGDGVRPVATSVPSHGKNGRNAIPLEDSFKEF
jgi:methyl-accepting chemotaxis protein